MNQFYRFCLFITPVFLCIACGNADEQSPNSSVNSEDEVKSDELLNEMLIDTLDAEAQWQKGIENNIHIFATAAVNDDISTVLDYINFPLKRDAPIPAINTVDEFKAYFPTLFDAELKAKLQTHLDAPDLIDMSSSNGTIGILSGLIWFDQVGSMIVSINYQSAAEKENLAAMEQKLRDSMHPILKDYTHNVFLGRTEDGLFRIDETEKGLRYASWYGDQNMASEPDFILWDGFSEKQGTAGGWTTTFDRADTKFILDQVDMCEDPEDCGLFLVIEDEGEITSKLVVTEILDPFTEL